MTTQMTESDQDASDIYDRLMDSEEYAGEEAVPGIAYDAMEEIGNLRTLAAKSGENALRAAFLMEGLHEAGYDACIKAHEGLGGCIELVQKLLESAPKITDLCCDIEQAGFEYPGVLDYEVTGYIGRFFGRYLIEHGDYPPDDVMGELIRKEVSQFFAQGLNACEADNIRDVAYGHLAKIEVGATAFSRSPA